MPVMDKEVRDFYLYFVGIKEDCSRLYNIHDEWSRDAITPHSGFGSTDPSLFYRGNIIEVHNMLRFIERVKNGL